MKKEKKNCNENEKTRGRCFAAPQLCANNTRRRGATEMPNFRTLCEPGEGVRVRARFLCQTVRQRPSGTHLQADPLRTKRCANSARRDGGDVHLVGTAVILSSGASSRLCSSETAGARTASTRTRLAVHSWDGVRFPTTNCRPTDNTRFQNSRYHLLIEPTGRG